MNTTFQSYFTTTLSLTRTHTHTPHTPVPSPFCYRRYSRYRRCRIPAISRLGKISDLFFVKKTPKFVGFFLQKTHEIVYSLRVVAIPWSPSLFPYKLILSLSLSIYTYVYQHSTRYLINR